MLSKGNKIRAERVRKRKREYQVHSYVQKAGKKVGNAIGNTHAQYRAEHKIYTVKRNLKKPLLGKI